MRLLVRAMSARFRRLFWPAFSAVCWVLWTTHNKFMIEHVFPKSAVSCLYNLTAILQLWKSLTKEEACLDWRRRLTRSKPRHVPFLRCAALLPNDVASCLFVIVVAVCPFRSSYFVSVSFPCAYGCWSWPACHIGDFKTLL